MKFSAVNQRRENYYSGASGDTSTWSSIVDINNDRAILGSSRIRALVSTTKQDYYRCINTTQQ